MTLKMTLIHPLQEYHREAVDATEPRLRASSVRLNLFHKTIINYIKSASSASPSALAMSFLIFHSTFVIIGSNFLTLSYLVTASV